jgi:hypothetical protein
MTTKGMMAENMFVGKSVLLGWLNSTLQLKLEKIEDVSCISFPEAAHPTCSV